MEVTNIYQVGTKHGTASGTLGLTLGNRNLGATQNSEIALRYSVQAFEPNKWRAGARGQTAIKLSQKPI